MAAALMFPADSVLIARGKFSTLLKMRKEQLERAQGICTTLVTTTHQAMKDCQERPPTNGAHLETIETCLRNLRDTRERIITLSLGLAELEQDAWGKE